MNQPRGQLVIVGFGIELGRHLTERTLSEIRIADRVLCLVDPLALASLKAIRPDVESLHGFYGVGKDRHITYQQMAEAMVNPVRAGERVCAVFYGHPGVFADAPHMAMQTLKMEGYAVRMDAGISAEACLYADLGIDPGKRGVISSEATQFLIYDAQHDPGRLLLLWQVGIVGDLSCTQLFTTEQRLQALLNKLLRYYPADHPVTLYEAAQLAIQKPRTDTISLAALPLARTSQITTLVVPPYGRWAHDEQALLDLGAKELLSANMR